MNNNINDIMQIMNNLNKYQSLLSIDKNEALNSILENKPELKSISSVISSLNGKNSDTQNILNTLLRENIGKESGVAGVDLNSIGLLSSLFNKNKAKKEVPDIKSGTKSFGIEPIINFASSMVIRDIVNLLSI